MVVIKSPETILINQKDAVDTDVLLLIADGFRMDDLRGSDWSGELILLWWDSCLCSPEPFPLRLFFS